MQTFPDRFRFAGTRSDAFRQIGNAVPPLLGEAAAEVLKPVDDADAHAPDSSPDGGRSGAHSPTGRNDDVTGATGTSFRARSPCHSMPLSWPYSPEPRSSRTPWRRSWTSSEVEDADLDAVQEAGRRGTHEASPAREWIV